MRKIPERLLAPDQVEALQGVDLQLYFHSHGAWVHSPKVGYTVAGVTKYRFDQITNTVNALDPTNGDTLCLEGVTDGPFLPEELLKTQRVYAKRLGLVHPPIISTDKDCIDSPMLLPNTNYYFDPNGTAALLEDVREKCASTTILYAGSLAATKGIRIAKIDMERQIRDEYKAELQRMRQEESFWGRFGLKPNVITLDVRNRHMVRRLGEAAVVARASAPAPAKPILLALIGKGHRRGIRYLLGRDKIPFTDVTNNPYDRIIDNVAVIRIRERRRLGKYNFVHPV